MNDLDIDELLRDSAGTGRAQRRPHERNGWVAWASQPSKVTPAHFIDPRRSAQHSRPERSDLTLCGTMIPNFPQEWVNPTARSNCKRCLASLARKACR